MKSAVVFNIQKSCINDGPGIRTTVFLKGCPLNCPWCHNKEAKGFGIEEIDGSTVGKTLTVKEVLSEVLKDRVFYKKTGGGLTLSGGEPLMQKDFAISVLKAAKKRKIHTAVETAGHINTKDLIKISKWVDLFLYDIKLTDSQKHKQYTGVGNELILENLKALDNKKVDIILRLVIVPEVNDNLEHFKAVAEIANSLKRVKGIEILPYHDLGETKGFTSLNQQVFRVPSVEEVENYILKIKEFTKLPVKKA